MTAEGLRLYQEQDREGFVKEIAEASLLGEINWDLRCFFDAGRGSLATYEIENKVILVSHPSPFNYELFVLTLDKKGDLEQTDKFALKEAYEVYAAILTRIRYQKKETSQMVELLTI